MMSNANPVRPHGKEKRISKRFKQQLSNTSITLMSRKTGINKTTIYRWINGYTKKITVENYNIAREYLNG